ncbi:alpha/beta hydrolase [Gandjariella thermophila]|nr:alpha/beta hydrolase [Gandjariella thermophila]
MTAPPALALVHSPLVGPLTWTPTAARLRRLGYPVVVPSLAGVVAGGPPYHARLAKAAARAVDSAHPAGQVVLVAHSAAGALLPGVADALAGRATAAVFVDAMLPYAGASWWDIAPVEQRAELSRLVREGRLPPWNEWFPASAVAALLPQADLRGRFVAELPEIPLDYFEEAAPSAAAWPPASGCGYLRLSEPYEAAARRAEQLGWLVDRWDADHLAMLTEPEKAATLIARMVEAVAAG